MAEPAPYPFQHAAAAGGMEFSNKKHLVWLLLDQTFQKTLCILIRASRFIKILAETWPIFHAKICNPRKGKMHDIAIFSPFEHLSARILMMWAHKYSSNWSIYSILWQTRGSPASLNSIFFLESRSVANFIIKKAFVSQKEKSQKMTYLDDSNIF